MATFSKFLRFRFEKISTIFAEVSTNISNQLSLLV